MICPNASTQQGKTFPPVVLWTPCSGCNLQLLPYIGKYKEAIKEVQWLFPAICYCADLLPLQVEQPSLPVETSISQGTVADVCLWVMSCVWNSFWAAQLQAGVKMNSSVTSTAPTRLAGPSWHKRNRKRGKAQILHQQAAKLIFCNSQCWEQFPFQMTPQEQVIICKNREKKPPLEVITERITIKSWVNDSFTQMRVLLGLAVISMK